MGCPTLNVVILYFKSACKFGKVLIKLSVASNVDNGLIEKLVAEQQSTYCPTKSSCYSLKPSNILLEIVSASSATATATATAAAAAPAAGSATATTTATATAAPAVVTAQDNNVQSHNEHSGDDSNTEHQAEHGDYGNVQHANRHKQKISHEVEKETIGKEPAIRETHDTEVSGSGAERNPGNLETRMDIDVVGTGETSQPANDSSENPNTTGARSPPTNDQMDIDIVEQDEAYSESQIFTARERVEIKLGVRYVLHASKVAGKFISNPKNLGTTLFTRL